MSHANLELRDSATTYSHESDPSFAELNEKGVLGPRLSAVVDASGSFQSVQAE